jgi:hypothetical protein
MLVFPRFVLHICICIKVRWQWSTTGIWSTRENACKFVAREAGSKGLYRSYTNSYKIGTLVCNCYWKLKEIKTITIQRICHLYYCINVLCLVGVFSNKQRYTNSRVVQLVPIVYCLYKKWISINVSISTFCATLHQHLHMENIYLS